MSQRITYILIKKNKKKRCEQKDHLQKSKKKLIRNISEPADHLQKKQGNKKNKLASRSINEIY